MRTQITAALAACALIAAAPLASAQMKEKEGQRSAQSQKEASGKLSRQDARYFTQLAQGNMAEVRTGKVALERAQSPEVKQFAERMIEDHGKLLEQQETMAKEKNVKLPEQPTKEQQAQLKKLQQAKGEQFDRAYMSHMVKDHQKTLELVKETASKAQDADLKAMAQKAEPIIAEHLKLAKQISDQAAAGGTAKGGKTRKD